MEGFLALVREYGVLVYALLFAYCALKSGALPFLAGYAAQIGALDLLPVAAMTALGGYLGDEVRFHVSRRHGIGFLSRWDWTRRLTDHAQTLLDRHGALYIFLYRYPKGMRTIGAFPVGLGDMAWKRFTCLNASSAASWACILIGAGYTFGAAIANAVSRNWGAASFAMLAGFVLLVFIAWRRTHRLAEAPAATGGPALR